MDVNHCAQVVGYAYATADNEDEREDTNNDNHNSKDNGGGSQDTELSVSQGYWIVRNQWSRYWGMNGYAYVAMGENTCGILNDMLIAYT
jgi:C1A family cysteine protease